MAVDALDPMNIVTAFDVEKLRIHVFDVKAAVG
jgi:hypothetical protein